MLLCSVFENFRDVTLKEFQLDPAHFYSAPGLSWSAMLKMTKVELQLITDIDSLNFVSHGIRGGVSFIAHRYAEANNPYIDNYDPTKELYLFLADANNLYAYGMTQNLPKSGFRFLSDREIQKLDILNVPDDGPKGYLLSVDLKYPEHLHDLHNDFPLVPEKKHIPNAMLSDYAKQLWLEHHPTKSGNITGRGKQEEIITDLSDKSKYILHFRNLKQYVDLGKELNAIYQVLEFDQDAWLKPYIDFNTKKRQEAKSEFENNFYKILNVSIFGKTIESSRNYKCIYLINNYTKLKRVVSKPSFESCKILHNNLVAAQCKNLSVTIHKPIYADQAILDINRILMNVFSLKYISRKTMAPSANFL